MNRPPRWIPRPASKSSSSSPAPRARPVAVIVVTHDPRIYRYADRMAEMEDGRILRVLDSPAAIAAAHLTFSHTP